MAWFKRPSPGIVTKQTERNDVPEGYWQKCPECGHIVSQKELEDRLMVCPKCGHHYPLRGLAYLELLFDPESGASHRESGPGQAGAFTRHDADLHSGDPLGFVDRKPYPARVAEAERKSELNDAAVSGTGTAGGHPLSVAAMDFSFIGGSMGSVVGEIVTRAIRRGVDEERAVMVVAQSGGARMMEGALSLMQMAKTSANLAVLAEKKLPYLVLLTHPTTGGVTASFAMLGDVQMAEPGALIGFAGPRVIRETIGRDLPPGFQTAEFLQEKGFVDLIVPRSQLRETTVRLLDHLMAAPAPPSPPKRSTSRKTRSNAPAASDT